MLFSEDHKKKLAIVLLKPPYGVLLNEHTDPTVNRIFRTPAKWVWKPSSRSAAIYRTIQPRESPPLT